MCSDKAINEAPYTKAVIAFPEEYSKEELREIKREHEEENKLRIINTKKEITYNAYEIAFKNSSEIFFKDSISIFNNFDTYGFMCYISIILISISIAIYSIKIIVIKKILTLTTLNLVLLLISKLFFYLHGNFEDINQIKIGYYLFFINSILIIYFCRKELKSQQ